MTQSAILVVGADKRLNVWDLRARDPVRHVNNPHSGPTNSVAVSRSGALFATAGEDTTVKLWDWKSLRCLGEFAAHSAAVTKVAFSSDDAFLASVAEDGTMAMWAVKA